MYRGRHGVARVNSRLRHGAVICAVVVGCILGGAAWAFAAQSKLGPERACKSAKKAEAIPTTPSAAAASTDPSTLEPERVDGVLLSYGRERSPDSEESFFGLAKGSNGLPPTGYEVGIMKRPLTRDEIDGEIARNDYFAMMRVTGPNEVVLTVCIDPGLVDVHPGTYRGSIIINDPRIEQLSVPVVATFQFRNWVAMALGMGFLVLVAGSVFVYCTDKDEDESDPGGEAPKGGTPRWFWKKGGPLRWFCKNLPGIGVGVAGAASVFNATYLRDPGWGAEAPTEWFALMGLMFTAFTTGFMGARTRLVAGRTTGRAGEETVEPVSSPQPRAA